MSVQTLYTAATGMEALETKLDVIANNLANVNTTAFKKDRANFEDLFYQHEVLPGSKSDGELTATGVSIGLGSKVSNVQSDFGQGAFQQTGRELDVAIEGNGFLQVTDPNGQRLFTRAGNLNINANGELVIGSASTGRKLDPPIRIPNDAVGIEISPRGEIFVRQVGNTQLTSVGILQLATFLNKDGLLKLGENLYGETEASGSPQAGTPGDTALGLGVLRQRFLEASNVEPVQELIDLITTQRAFELNSQAVQAGDQILQLISNLKRS
ncbi:MAG: flagellar basal-body rod protein FlgG [Planctomycetes bacterium]|nr:flagellar basal-body rod protein FlgG [Planctomycetota bacterium]